MKNWKITIEYKGKVMEIMVEAKLFSDAYVAAELKYPGCVVKSVSEIREDSVRDMPEDEK
jgi:hypothetical protein